MVVAMHDHTTLALCHRNRLASGYLLIFHARIGRVYVATHQMVFLDEGQFSHLDKEEDCEKAAKMIAEKNGLQVKRHSTSPDREVIIYKLV